VTLDERIERARAREQELYAAWSAAFLARMELEDLRDAEKARKKAEGEESK
jgi:hypothetical protein